MLPSLSRTTLTTTAMMKWRVEERAGGAGAGPPSLCDPQSLRAQELLWFFLARERSV